MDSRRRAALLAVPMALFFGGCGAAAAEVDLQPEVQAAPPAPTTTTTTTVNPAAVFAGAWAAWTPEERVRFEFYTATPEQQAAFFAYISPPPPPPPPPAVPKRAPAPAPTAPPTTAVRPASSGGSAPNSFLACVRQRESGGNYQAHNPSGAAGAYQFMPGTWAHLNTGYSSPLNAPPAVQDAAAARLYAEAGRQPWAGPGC